MDDGDGGGSFGPPRALKMTTPTNTEVFGWVLFLLLIGWFLRGAIWLVQNVASAF